MDHRLDKPGEDAAGMTGLLRQAWARLNAQLPAVIGIAVVLLGLLAAGAIGLAAMLTVLVVAVILLGFASRSEFAAAGPVEAAQSSSAADAGMFSLIAALPVPCFLLDAGGLIVTANPPALSVIPLRVGDSIITRLRSPEFLAAFDRVVAGGPAEHVDYTGRPSPARIFAVWLAPLDMVDGRPRRVALVLDDRTELRRVERVRADFVANASHELRTPLASLAGFIETLQGPAREDAIARDRFLGVMHEQATRMARLIDDLLSLSRVEMAPAIRPGVEVDLKAVATHVADALSPLASENDVAIGLSLPDSPVLVPGNRDELVQLLENLVENAVRYGAEGKRVEVTLTAPPANGGEAVLSVRDFGQGIPPEHLPRLTERFYRVDVEHSRKHRGTGLGLAIVKHIATRHRARLQIESQPGEGALFTVQFAQARLEGTPALSAAEPAAPARGHVIDAAPKRHIS